MRSREANAYLHEQQLWTHKSLHHEYLLQQMFLHATSTGQKEHGCTICWGKREPLLERNLLAESTTMELIHCSSQCQDFDDLYWEVYQLHRLPG